MICGRVIELSSVGPPGVTSWCAAGAESVVLEHLSVAPGIAWVEAAIQSVSGDGSGPTTARVATRLEIGPLRVTIACKNGDTVVIG